MTCLSVGDCFNIMFVCHRVADGGKASRYGR